MTSKLSKPRACRAQNQLQQHSGKRAGVSLHRTPLEYDLHRILTCHEQRAKRSNVKHIIAKRNNVTCHARVLSSLDHVMTKGNNAIQSKSHPEAKAFRNNNSGSQVLNVLNVLNGAMSVLFESGKFYVICTGV